MSLDWLETLERSINSGREHFVTPGVQPNEWTMSMSIDEVRAKAKRTANIRGLPSHVFKLLNKMDTAPEESFLVVRKILEPGPQGNPRFLWSIVDTRDAAEVLRDVSQGPTPYFGLTIIETCNPPT